MFLFLLHFPFFVVMLIIFLSHFTFPFWLKCRLIVTFPFHFPFLSQNPINILFEEKSCGKLIPSPPAWDWCGSFWNLSRWYLRYMIFWLYNILDIKRIRFIISPGTYHFFSHNNYEGIQKKHANSKLFPGVTRFVSRLFA